MIDPEPQISTHAHATIQMPDGSTRDVTLELTAEQMTMLNNDVEKEISKGMQDSEIVNPDWSSGGHVHNWRNHVGEQTKRLWSTFTPEQKAALAFDAETSASDENWD